MENAHPQAETPDPTKALRTFAAWPIRMSIHSWNAGRDASLKAVLALVRDPGASAESHLFEITRPMFAAAMVAFRLPRPGVERVHACPSMSLESNGVRDR